MDYEKLYKKALRFADKKGMGDEREDFAQECLIKAFEKGPINLEYIFLNYRNSFRTDKRVLSAPQGKFSAHGIISLDAPSTVRTQIRQNMVTLSDALNESWNASEKMFSLSSVFTDLWKGRRKRRETGRHSSSKNG